MLHPGARRKDHHQSRTEHYSTCAEIRLEHDQRKGRTDQRQRRQQAACEGGDIIIILTQPVGQEQDHPHLHELGGLNTEAADAQPAPRTAADHSDTRH
ncbi:hypothetical protein D3C75_1050410 [compost metagenome]